MVQSLKRTVVKYTPLVLTSHCLFRLLNEHFIGSLTTQEDNFILGINVILACHEEVAVFPHLVLSFLLISIEGTFGDITTILDGPSTKYYMENCVL